jgi:hypothetical protein
MAPSFCAFCQARDYAAIDAAVIGMPRAKNVEGVVAFIAQNARDDWERARGAFVWMTHNIAYDVEAFFRGTRPALDAKAVFEVGKSVCQGYASLFASIAGGLGLQVAVIPGYAKAYAYAAGQRFHETNHAWNAVKLDGAWHFMETTWGAGHVDFRTFVADYSPVWFDMDPRLFALNHMPADSQWLLLDPPMTLADYERAPYVPTYELENLIDSGFSSGELIQLLSFAPFPQFFGAYARAFKAMGGSLADIIGYLSEGAFPAAYTYPNASPVLVEFPKTAKLKAGTKYRFAFRLSGCSEAAVVAGGKFTFLTKKDDFFSGEAAAAPGTVDLCVRMTDSGSRSYSPLMEWWVQ